MKTKLFGLMVIAAWLCASPARAITYYDYNVDFTDFTEGKGEISGSIQTNCDACVLNSANYVTSWSLKATDGSSISSSESTADIVISDPGIIIQATATGIYTVTNPTPSGNFEFCGDTTDCWNFTNFFHSPPQPAPILSLDWTEGGSITLQSRTSYTNGGGGPFVGAVVQVAALADTIECTGNLCVTIPATPLPGAFPLFATGLGALGLLGWRRKRKKAPAITA